MAPSAPLLRGISPWLRALAASTILLGGLSPMTITCLGGFAFFAITAARLGGFTIFTVAATWLGGRASLSAGVTLTSTFSGALSRRTAQGLFAGRHRRITNRHPGRAHSARVTTSSGLVLGESRTLPGRAATRSRKGSSQPVQVARARGKVGMLWQPRDWWLPAEFPL